MKKLSFFASLIIMSCSEKLIPIKGSYPQTPMIFKSQNNFDNTWDKLIDIFAQKGLAIKLIDRSSGLIVSEKSLLTATIEGKDGIVLDKSAFIVIPKYIYNGMVYPATGTKNSSYSAKKQLETNPVYGEWNVRIKKDESRSTINININNITYNDVIASSKIINYKPVNDYKSTGIFENILAEMIK